jgi:hypothetical protein
MDTKANPVVAAAQGNERLRQLEVRWVCEERAVSQLLLELECELEHIVRELSFRRLLGEPCDSLEARAMLLQAECDALQEESAHVQLALCGVRAELRPLANATQDARQKPAAPFADPIGA